MTTVHQQRAVIELSPTAGPGICKLQALVCAAAACACLLAKLVYATHSLTQCARLRARFPACRILEQFLAMVVA